MILIFSLLSQFAFQAGGFFAAELFFHLLTLNRGWGYRCFLHSDEQVVFCDRDREGIGEALEIELVDRIRGVRDKFAQEDLTIRVDRVDK